MAGRGSVEDSVRDAAAEAALRRFEKEEARKRDAKAKHEKAKADAKQAEEDELMAMKTAAAAAAAEVLEMKQEVKSAYAKEGARLAAEERDRVARESGGILSKTEESVLKRSNSSMMVMRECEDDDVRSLKAAIVRSEEARRAARKAVEEKLEQMKREAAAAGERLEMKQAVKSAQAKEAARLAAEERSRSTARRESRTLKETASETTNSLKVTARADSYEDEVKLSLRKAEERAQQAREASRKLEDEILDSMRRDTTPQSDAMERTESIKSLEAREAARLAAERRARTEGIQTFTPSSLAYWEEVRDREMKNEKDSKGNKDFGNVKHRDMMQSLAPIIASRNPADRQTEIVDVSGNQSENDERITLDRTHKHSYYNVELQDGKFGKKTMQDLVEEYFTKDNGGARPKERSTEQHKDEDNSKPKYGYKKGGSDEKKSIESEKNVVSVLASQRSGNLFLGDETHDLDKEGQRYKSGERKTIVAEKIGMSGKLRWVQEGEKMNQEMTSNFGKNYDCEQDRQRYRNEEKKTMSVAGEIGSNGKVRWLKECEKMNQEVKSNIGKNYDSDQDRQRYRNEEKKSVIEPTDLMKWFNGNENNKKMESSNVGNIYDTARGRQRLGSEEREIVLVSNLIRRDRDMNKAVDNNKRTLEEQSVKPMKNEHEMENSLLICGSCIQKYNFKGRLPRELYCKHSICSSCIRNRTNLDNSVTCPHCPKETSNVHEPQRCPINEELLEMMYDDSQVEIHKKEVVCSGGADRKFLLHDYEDDSMSTQREGYNKRDYFMGYGSTDRQSCDIWRDSKPKMSQELSSRRECVKSPHSSKCLEMGVRPTHYCVACQLWLCSKCSQVDHSSIKCEVKPMIEQLGMMKRKYDLVNERTHAMLEKSIGVLEDERTADETLHTWMDLTYDGLKSRQDRTTDAMTEGRNLLGTLEDVASSMKHSSNLMEAVTSFEILDALETEAKNWSLKVDVDATDAEEMSVCIKYLLKRTIKLFMGKDGATTTLYATNKVPRGKLFSQVKFDGGRYYLPALTLNKSRDRAHILPVHCYISSQKPSSTLVYLDLSWGNLCRGRVFIRLTGDTLRGRQFISLCTGESGLSLRDTPFHRVWWKGLPGEHVWTGDVERGDGSGGRTPYNSTTTRQTALVPSREVPISAGLVAGRYEKKLSSIFRIYTRDSKDGSEEEGFGQVEFGLDVVRSAVAVKDISEVLISDCGLVLEM